MDDTFALLDWKRQVSALYQAVRSATDAEAAWDLWRKGRDDLLIAATTTLFLHQ